jgi:NAD+ diphosphatase
MASPRAEPNFLAGPYLDRLANLRKDDARLREALVDPSTLFVPVWRTRSLIARADTNATARFVSAAELVSRESTPEPILLGSFRGHLCFAIELEGNDAPTFDGATEVADLRLIAGTLPREEAGLLAYARAMITWREKHRYCGRCGSPTVALQGGHVLACSDPACATQAFPRIDPAVIVLVSDGERALLGRQAAWPPGRYSTIAGFVEPGESLEDAVAREVREETGIVVDEVTYHSSQPWPFPSSLMLGFMAHAATTDIDRSDDELEDARWLTRREIGAGDVALPTTHSISFRLIEEWYDAASARPLRDEPNARLWTPPPRPAG